MAEEAFREDSPAVEVLKEGWSRGRQEGVPVSGQPGAGRWSPSEVSRASV